MIRRREERKGERVIEVSCTLNLLIYINSIRREEYYEM